MKVLLRILVMALGISGGVMALAHGQSREVPLPGEAELNSTESAAKPSFELADDLDGLFNQLARTRDKKRAEWISSKIWEFWQTSDSRSVDLLTNWARQASGNRDFVVALDLLDQVIALRPDYAEGFNQRATLHFMMDNYGKSIADIERTLALEPRHYGALSGLAAILEGLDRKEEALETWYRVLSIYPALESGQESVIRLEEELANSRI